MEDGSHADIEGHRRKPLGALWRKGKQRQEPALFVELARRGIESTNAELVFDPFMGSGTTAIAAEECNRNRIGFEISANYCALANERIEAARGIRRPLPVAERVQSRDESIM
jgi:hypothetical protein